MGGTIFALASGAGRAGVAVMRVSGPAAGAALDTLTGRPRPVPRMAVLRRLAWRGEALDEALVLWFPGPASFTGEDVAELHLHGGRAVVAGVAEALVGLGLRPAEAGEFTRRAFDNGKLDLTAAEGLADLVAAETAAQRRQALAQAEGGLARLYDGWRGRLIRAQAHLEAAIDFADEDVPAEAAGRALDAVAGLAAEIEAHLAGAECGERRREGVRVAILGAPNVGKSSLLNRLARREAAIVSAIAGTTRDVIEVHLDLGGYAVIVADTAGLREQAGEIESEGIRRALARAEAADLKLVVVEAGQALPPAARALLDGRAWLVANKIDRGGAVPQAARPAFAVSAATGAGIEALLAALAEEVARLAGDGAGVLPTRARHRAALCEAAAALRRAIAAPLPDLAAEDLRLAARALGRITGRVDVEEVLDVIFGEFCIGK